MRLHQLIRSRIFFGLLGMVLVACSSTADPLPQPNRAPSGQLSVTPTSGQAPLDIRATVNASDPDGDAITLSWQVDGTALDQTDNTLDYTFAQAGNYTLSVILSDGELERTLETSIVVLVPADNQAPIANFTLDTSSSPEIFVDATDSSDADGSIREYRWDFGDGTTITGSSVDGGSVRHTYEQAGTFTVRLTVTDDDGATASTTQDVTVDTPNLRPAGSPDVVIVGFAGRCGFPCIAPNENVAYLDDASRTLQGIQNDLQSQGYVVEYKSYAARLSANVPSVSVDSGYLEAEAYLEGVYENWIRGFDNPTRIIAVGHSHGTVWMNLLLFNRQDITFDYAISFDGICFFWWFDNEASIRDYYDRQGFLRPYPLASGDPCGIFTIPNLESKQNINDVIPENVRVNLEVQAGSSPLLNDAYDNYRSNGSRSGIFTIRPAQGHFGAGAVHYSNGVAMSWVSQQLQTLGFLEGGEPVPSSRSIARHVPAPPGFEYVD